MNNGIAHIPKDKRTSYCGQSVVNMFHFLDLKHAEAAIKVGTRVRPCVKCLTSAREQSNHEGH